MEQLVMNTTLIVGIIGVLAFAVSIITQVFKGVSGLKKIPTDILVFVLSIGITVVAFIAYMQYIQQAILWYMIHLSICTVYRNYGSGVYCLHAVHTASDFVVYDHCCYYGRILGGICGYVRMGKSSGTLEEIL